MAWSVIAGQRAGDVDGLDRLVRDHVVEDLVPGPDLHLGPRRGDLAGLPRLRCRPRPAAGGADDVGLLPPRRRECGEEEQKEQQAPQDGLPAGFFH